MWRHKNKIYPTGPKITRDVDPPWRGNRVTGTASDDLFPERTHVAIFSRCIAGGILVEVGNVYSWNLTKVSFLCLGIHIWIKQTKFHNDNIQFSQWWNFRQDDDKFLSVNSSSELQIPRPLRWRHNERDNVSNHQPHDCLLNRLFTRRSKKTSKLRVTGLCAGNSPETGEFPAQRASNAENGSIWWRHHDNTKLTMAVTDITNVRRTNIRLIYFRYQIGLTEVEETVDNKQQEIMITLIAALHTGKRQTYNQQNNNIWLIRAHEYQ